MSLILGLSPACARTRTRTCCAQAPSIAVAECVGPARHGRRRSGSCRPDRAALHYPVAVTATVTFADPDLADALRPGRDRRRPRPPRRARPRSSVGERLQIDGVTDAGDPLPLVVAERVTKLGTDALPAAKPFVAGPHAPVSRRRRAARRRRRHPARRAPTRPAISSPSSSRSTARRSALTVAGHWQQPLPQALVNAQVRVTGVLARLIQPEPQTRGLHLLVPDRDAITVTKPARPDPFETFAPSTGPLEHLTPAAGAAPDPRPRLRHARHRRRTCSSKATAARSASISTAGQDVPKIGTEIEASGFLAPGDTPALRYALAARHRRAAAQPEAVARPVAHLLRDDAAGRLTRTVGLRRREPREGPGAAPHARRRRHRADGHRAARSRDGRSRSLPAAASS